MLLIRKKEHILILLILIILATTITYIQYTKFVYSSSIRADTGFLFEMTENIANGNGPISSIHAAMNNFFRNNFQKTTADQICMKELNREKEEFRTVFESHRYYITYIFAIFAKIFDIKAIYYTAHVFGFFILLYIIYRILRESNTPIIPSLLFLILVFVHPAFSLSISGQLYAERFFIPFAMIFLYFLNKKDLNLLGLYFPAFLVSLVSERSSLVMGIFILGYIVLFYNSLERKIKLHLSIIGSVLLSFAIYSMKVLKESNIHYSKSSFMPSSIDDIINKFSNPTFVDNLLVFGIVSFLFLGIFTALRWRYFLMVFVMILPNILGNIGGAEKTGYYTHYHTLYFPFLVFASTLGYIKLIKYFKQKKYFYILSASMLGLILLSSSYSPFSKNISHRNMLQENALLKDLDLYPTIFNKNSLTRRYIDNYQKIANIIPDGSIITSAEMMQTILWKNKINYYYPMGIDIADYAVLWATKINNEYEYSGAVSYFGANEAKKIDKCITKRMENVGYDFKNQIIINNFAIIKRNKK